MQEDKEGIFDCAETVNMCLDVFTPMIESMTALTGNMRKAAEKGFINATDLADYLVKKGLPFRSAYKISGQIVAECLKSGEVLETLPLNQYKKHSDLFDTDLYDFISLETCVEKRISEGGTSVKSVEAQIQYLKGILNNG
jgi:argininosuccinate lyase